MEEKKTAQMLNRARCAYDYLYNDQMVGATDEYLEFLESTFGPTERHDWDNKRSASSALVSLISEVYESVMVPESLLSEAGVDSELKMFIGIEAEPDSDKTTPAETKTSAMWIAEK